MADRTYSNGKRIANGGAGLLSRIAEMFVGAQQPQYEGTRTRDAASASSRVPIVCATPAGVMTIPLDPASLPPGQIAIVIPRPKEPAPAIAVDASAASCSAET